MKRTRTEYFCDICRAPVDSLQTHNDYTGRNFGLCDDCRETHSLRSWTMDDGGLVLKIESIPNLETKP